MSKRARQILYIIIIICLVIFGGISAFLAKKKIDMNKEIRPIQTYKFEDDLNRNNIKGFQIRPSQTETYDIQGMYRKNYLHKVHKKHLKGFSTTVVMGDDNTLSYISKKSRLHHVKENASYMKSATKSHLFLMGILRTIFIVFVAILCFVPMFWPELSSHFESATGNDKGNIRFKDVAGEDAEKNQLVEIINFLKHPKQFEKLGAVIPHGILLEGPPGTGKTLLAKATAGEANVPFYATSGSEFESSFFGMSAKRIRSLFKKAKRNAPSIIFIDEIDAIGGKRKSSSFSERTQIINQLLTEMDGFRSKGDRVVVIGATNRADTLDPALTRSGRFDMKVTVNPPDVKGRYDILKIHAKTRPLAKNVNLKEIAHQTPGFTGADLANLINQSALIAVSKKHTKINSVDVSQAEDQVIAGPADKDAVINKKDLHTVAVHEAGHAVVGLALNHAREVRKITIVPHGNKGGYTMMLPKHDSKLLSKADAIEQLAGLLGGRVAEEILYHFKSSGGFNDFQQATKLAKTMITKLGMGSLGDVVLNQNNYSEDTSIKIDQEIEHLLMTAHNNAYRIIQQHREQHYVLVNALLKYRTLNYTEIKSLWNSGKMPDNDPKVEN